MEIFILILRIIGISLLPSALGVLLYVLFYKTKKIKDLNYWIKQIIIGVLFGCACVGAYFISVEINIDSSSGLKTFVGNGTVSPLIAGLLFGWPSGVITAIAGAAFRLCLLNDPLRFSVFTSILISGAVGALCNHFIYRRKRPRWYYGALTGVFVESSNFLLIFIFSLNIQEAYSVLKKVDVCCIITSALSIALTIISMNLIDKHLFKSSSESEKKVDNRENRKPHITSKPIAHKIQSGLFFTTLFTLIVVSASTLYINARKTVSSLQVSSKSAYNDISNVCLKFPLTDPASYCESYSIDEKGMVCLVSASDNYPKRGGELGETFQYNEIVSIKNNKKFIEKHGNFFRFDDKTTIADFSKEQLSDAKNGIYNYFIKTIDGVKYFCAIYEFIIPAPLGSTSANYEFRIITFSHYDEVLSSVGITLRVAIYTELIAFIVLYAILNILVNRIVVNKIYAINSSLEKITYGDLNEVVKAKGSKEIEMLVDDINLTVGALKNYAGEVEKRIEGDLELAKKIQTTAVPRVFPLEKEYEIFATMSTAKEVGGDFYDYVIIDDRHVLILIADVSGKGIPAALFMMRAKTLVKSLVCSGVSIEEVANRANRELCNQNTAGLFVTAWMGIFDITTGEINYVNCGHCNPILKQGNKYKYLLSNRNFVLAAVEDYDFKADSLTLKANDLLLLYTDGVTEATNKNMELFGEERLMKVLQAAPSFDCKQLLDVINDEVDKFQKGVDPADDVTMVSLRYYGNKGRELSNEITVKAKSENTTMATNFVKTFLYKSAIPSKINREMAIVVDELFSNICYYAYPKEVGNITIKLDVKNGTLKMSFIDSGIPFDPSKEIKVRKKVNPEKMKFGGLGLVIVHKSVDRMIYLREKNENIFIVEKDFK